MKFGDLIPASGEIKVHSDALRHTTINARLLLMNGDVFLEGSFQITIEKFIDIPPSEVRDWIKKWKRSKTVLTNVTESETAIYASRSSNSTFDLYLAERIGTNKIQIDSLASSPERPRKVVSNEQLAELIATDFYEGKLDMSSRKRAPDRVAWDTLPEVGAALQFRRRGVPDDVVRLFLTFVAAMDRSRNSTRLWSAGVELFESHPEVFDPHRVASLTFYELQDLLNESGVSQRHEFDTRAWQCIAKSLAAGDGSHMHEAIHQGIGDAEELRKEVQIDLSLPMLRGEKVGPMWIRMLAEPGGAKGERRNNSSV